MAGPNFSDRMPDVQSTENHDRPMVQLAPVQLDDSRNPVFSAPGLTRALEGKGFGIDSTHPDLPHVVGPQASPATPDGSIGTNSSSEGPSATSGPALSVPRAPSQHRHLNGMKAHHGNHTGPTEAHPLQQHHHQQHRAHTQPHGDAAPHHGAHVPPHHHTQGLSNEAPTGKDQAMSIAPQKPTQPTKPAMGMGMNFSP